MSEAIGSRFAGAAAWCERLGTVRDVVRQELVAGQLAAHLPSTGRTVVPLRVLDVGCGQGTQALRLARMGHRVVGVDVDAGLLEAARTTLTEEPPEIRSRVRLERVSLQDLSDRFADPFDAVCCHGVVMYLPSLAEAVDALAALLRPGGVLSLLTRNRAGIAMRAGMTGDWTAALEGFDARTYTNRLGLSDVRADDPDEVFTTLDQVGVQTVAWYGVRLFTDHWGDVNPADDLEDLIAAEEAAGRRDPYRRLAALTHTIGIREE